MLINKQAIEDPKPVGNLQIIWKSFLGSEEPSLKLLHLAKLQCTISSPISNCRRSKSVIFIYYNINYKVIHFCASNFQSTFDIRNAWM